MKSAKEQVEEALRQHISKFRTRKEIPTERVAKIHRNMEKDFIAGVLFGAKLGFEAAKEQGISPIPEACAYYFKYDTVDDFLKELK